ncbi:RagB/SusD family nutrient uptake outer membrane protein [Chryseolinea lacunae]|uniref:RagB/SusD family nutrient uptake outer membrane protein n=1 Tax=Chryseolinea lacunae TaxID=2801331 RepID=A0ABS1L008_9BACT|nr:RagB/SusD family nutrient uptake outer membrane protein [Chryseolinea lacunae]MBL0744848.1 RagB/SusD family nutrient uptake outer membrane protein [Chryseolinea lacunae]
MKTNPYLRAFLVVLTVLLAFACSEDYLDKKPDKSLVVPQTLEDFQALLDNADRVMNITPAIGMIASDDAFTTDNGWKGLLTATERNTYIWAKDTYNGEPCNDWNIPYQQVFYANVVLEGLEKIAVTPASEAQWKSLKGSALFFRAHALHQLTDHFTLPYTEKDAATTLGIPIRLSPNVNAPARQATLAQTYAQILEDLTLSLDFLPVHSPYKTRPTLPAAYALLARIHLTMAHYKEAEDYASKALALNSVLLDYNTLNPNDFRPIPRMNDEILFHSQQILYSYAVFSNIYADTTLYASYNDKDLRKTMFFRLRSPNRYSFKGSYTGSSPFFGGIANDEVYLIRAESRVRQGNSDGARKDLNALLEKRWVAGMFIPITETNPGSLLGIILEERQKELAFRTSRWSDLRRLGKDSKFAVTLSRVINGVTYTLPPNDLRYAFPLPNQEIQNSDVEQNPR